ncbi:MAG: YihY/virulence factor BrkB family protein [Ignavibacteriaceae bacterium]
MKFNIKAVWKFIADVFDRWSTDKAPKLGAALSFYTIFSLAPLLIIVISVAGLLFGEEAARGEIVYQIEGLIGRNGAEIVQTALKNTSNAETGLIAIVISLVTSIIGSTIVFVELQDSLDMIWKVKPKPGSSLIKGLIKDRIRSFTVVIGTGFLLLVSLVISAVISALNNFINENFVLIPFWILELVNIIISFGIVYIMFAMIYKILPDVHLAWGDVWIGSLVTSSLFVLGKYLIGIYIGTSSLSSTYGAAGSLVVLLLWVYYSAQIIFLGAEFTAVYAEKYGSGVRPKSKFVRYHFDAGSPEKV